MLSASLNKTFPSFLLVEFGVKRLCLGSIISANPLERFWVEHPLCCLTYNLSPVTDWQIWWTICGNPTSYKLHNKSNQVVITRFKWSWYKYKSFKQQQKSQEILHPKQRCFRPLCREEKDVLIKGERRRLISRDQNLVCGFTKWLF